MTGTRPASRRAASHSLSWLLLSLLTLAFLLAALPLSLLSGQLGNGIVTVVTGIPCAAVGVVVARRQPGNPLGWLFLVTGGCLFVSNDAGDYSFTSIASGTGCRSGLPPSRSTSCGWRG